LPHKGATKTEGIKRIFTGEKRARHWETEKKKEYVSSLRDWGKCLWTFTGELKWPHRGREKKNMG